MQKGRRATRGAFRFFTLAAVASALLLAAPQALVAQEEVAVSPQWGVSEPGFSVSIEDLPVATPETLGPPTEVPLMELPDYDEREMQGMPPNLKEPGVSPECEDGEQCDTAAPDPVQTAQASVQYGPNFDSISNTANTSIVPDNGLAVGPSHIVQVVNFVIQIFNKSGGTVSGPTTLSSFFGVPASRFAFDPKALYDQLANRFVVVALEKNRDGFSNASNYLIGVSKTSNPTSWCVFRLDATLDGGSSTNNWADFPGLGLDNQAVYITSNQFSFAGNAFQYAKIRILDKTSLYNTACPAQPFTDFAQMLDSSGFTAATVKPAHTFGTPGVEYLVNTLNFVSNVTFVTLWKITNPTSSPILTKQAINGLTGYRFPGSPWTAQQLGPNDTINMIDIRIQNVVYRNGFIYFTHTILSDTAKCANSCVKAVKVRVSDGAVIWEEETGLSTSFHYYPALMVDNRENFFLVFNRSSDGEYVGIRYYGRRNGQSAESTALVKSGEGNYARFDTLGRNRWGDYSDAALDPSAPCRVWLSGEYARPSNFWRMRITQVGYPPVRADFNANMSTDVAVFRPSTGTWFIKDQTNVVWGGAGDTPVMGDYDGDGDTDIAVWRPSTGEWFIKDQTNVVFGGPGDIPVPGDYNGDCSTDIAVFRPSTGTWFIKDQANVVFGASGDIPVPGDYDGDGDTDIAVWRPATGTWFIKDQTNVVFGGPGDIPMVGDYDGDGDDDIAVFRPSTGTWFVRNQFNVVFGAPGDVPLPRDRYTNVEIAVFRNGTWFIKDQPNVVFGASGDEPVPADYNGDFFDEIAVFRNGTWFIRNQPNVVFGTTGDNPVPDDYDGDGDDDIAVWRPSTGTWFIKDQTNVVFGASGDFAVPADYDGDGDIDIAVWRPSTGTWFIKDQTNVVFGASGDMPAPCDYNGDGTDDIAVFRPSTGTWFVKDQFNVVFGQSGDLAVEDDYNGNGACDIAVFRPSTGEWFVKDQFNVVFGASGDEPVESNYSRPISD